MKYIIIDSEPPTVFEEVRHYVFIFSEEVIHATMLESAVISVSIITPFKIRSAGYYYNENGMVMVSDQRSESMRTGPKEGDQEIISDFLGNISNVDSVNIRTLAALKKVKMK